MKNQILASLLGCIVLFLLGGLFYGTLLADFYASNAGSASGTMRSDEQMVWWALVLGNLFQAYFMVYIFSKLANITTFMDGLKAGAVIGIITGLWLNMIMYGTSNIMNLTASLVDPVVTAVMMGIAGGVIGMILGRK